MQLLGLNAMILFVWLCAYKYFKIKGDDGLYLIGAIHDLWLHLTIPVAGSLCNFVAYTYLADYSYFVLSVLYMSFALVSLITKAVIVELERASNKA